ncbi:MAG: zinc ribbon domain-containing protein [Gemmatimonadaceae bacterium]
MSDGVLALVAGTTLAVAALAFVLYPLFFTVREPARSAPPEDAIEARVRAYREARPTCARCGLRPEPDAEYCSTCGAFLSGACRACNAPVTERGAGFCSTCGAALGGGPGALA